MYRKMYEYATTRSMLTEEFDDNRERHRLRRRRKYVLRFLAMINDKTKRFLEAIPILLAYFSHASLPRLGPCETG